MDLQIKHFLFRTSAFCSMFLIITIITFLFYRLIISQNKSIFKIDKSCNILILGDSHTECALNDSLFSSAVNISSSADAYFYSYLKMKKFIENNPQINTIILGFGYHDLGFSLEEWTYGDKFILEKIPKYFFLMNGKEILQVFKFNPRLAPGLIPEIYRSAFKLTIKSILGNNYKQVGFGSYLNLLYNKLEEDIQRLKKEKNRDVIKFNYSPTQVKYLLLISDFCKKHNIRLILLSTPIYKNLRQNYKNIKEYYYIFYKKYLSNNTLLDFSNLNLSDSSYADCEHLNYFGARDFSKFVNNKIAFMLKNQK